MGNRLKATKREATRAKVTVRAIGRNSCDAIPCTNTMGKNTAMVVMVEAAMAPVTSLVPVLAASTIPIPSCRCRKMFSSTTMELSTIIPTPRAKPPRVMIFSVRPPK